MEVVTTIMGLSWASAHGCSQLKHQKLRVGGYTKEVLEWFDYPHASAHPDTKLAARVYHIVTSLVLC